MLWYNISIKCLTFFTIYNKRSKIKKNVYIMITNIYSVMQSRWNERIETVNKKELLSCKPWNIQVHLLNQYVITSFACYLFLKVSRIQRLTTLAFNVNSHFCSNPINYTQS